MIKTYISYSDISINVHTNKKNVHITFRPYSANKGSVFKTDDRDIQIAIERHYNFGKLFFLKEEYEVITTPQEEEIVSGDKLEIIEVKVNSMQEAKDYLADKYGISRTALRNPKSIEAEAEKYGIKFIMS